MGLPHKAFSIVRGMTRTAGGKYGAVDAIDFDIFFLKELWLTCKVTHRRQIIQILLAFLCDIFT